MISVRLSSSTSGRRGPRASMYLESSLGCELELEGLINDGPQIAGGSWAAPILGQLLENVSIRYQFATSARIWGGKLVAPWLILPAPHSLRDRNLSSRPSKSMTRKTGLVRVVRLIPAKTWPRLCSPWPGTRRRLQNPSNRPNLRQFSPSTPLGSASWNPYASRAQVQKTGNGAFVRPRPVAVRRSRDGAFVTAFRFSNALNRLWRDCNVMQSKSRSVQL